MKIGEYRVWLWPNLLSLDAPLVALLWQLLFIRCFHAGAGDRNAWLAPLLLVSTVWLIYAADRTFDAWTGDGGRPRHRFYRRHWRAILPIWTTVLAATACLAWTVLPRALVERGAGLGIAVFLYFAAVHGTHRRWPKEAAVAVIFALGASLASWTHLETRADILSVALFACLCWINCVAIEKWERPESQPGESGVPVSALSACVGVAAILILHRDRHILAAAEASSAAALLLLDRVRWKLSADALRVLADAALLSPLLFLPLAGMRF
jgi:hypothetical protein